MPLLHIPMNSDNTPNADVTSTRLLKLSQRDWGETVNYPFRTLKDIERALGQIEEDLENIKIIARQFMDESNMAILGRVVKKGSYPGMLDDSSLPYYLSYSSDKSFDLVKWRCKYRDQVSGKVLNNLRLTGLSDDMLSQAPERLRDKMIHIERRRIELNYQSSILGFKRNRLHRTLQQISATQNLKDQYC